MPDETVTQVAESSPAAQDPIAVEKPQDPSGDTADKGEQVPWHQDKRWQEFIQQRKQFQQYQQLGTPEQLTQALGTLQYYNQLIEQTQQEEAKGDEKAGDAEDAVKAARKELLKVFPELAQIQKVLEGLKQREQLEVMGRAQDARSSLTYLLEKHGISQTKANLVKYEEALTGVIGADPDLSRLFLKDPREAVRKAWDELTSEFTKTAARKEEAAVQRDKEPLKTLPKTHGPGGGAPDSRGDMSGPPKSLKEATARVKSLLEKR